MKYATVEEVLASFPHEVLPTVQGEPDCQTIHATWKFLQANSREIDTHLGDGTLGHLGLIISDASYAMIAPITDSVPTLWTTPQAPGRAPANTDGTAAQISAARHIWEEDVQTYWTCTSIQQALKKQMDLRQHHSGAGLGILNSRLSPCSSRFKIAPNILKQGGVLIGHPQQINVGYAKNICDRSLHECMSSVE
jgi:hypothetical protein